MVIIYEFQIERSASSEGHSEENGEIWVHISTEILLDVFAGITFGILKELLHGLLKTHGYLQTELLKSFLKKI